MANDTKVNAKYVTAAKPAVGGAVFRAPLGTPLPTSTTDPLNAAFKCLGYISTDGYGNTPGRTSESLTAWGGDTVLNSQTASSDEHKFTLIEALNIEVQKTVFGDDNVSGDLESGMTVSYDGEQKADCAYVIDTILKGAAKRTVIPRASITALEEIPHKDNEPIAYGLTLSAVKDENGKYHYDYYKAAQPVTVNQQGV